MELNFKAFGEGFPIVILHGLFGTSDNWQTIAKQLAKDYWVFILDQRDHGRSPHTDGLDYERMAGDLAEFLEQQWIYEAHIIGHSMGGKTAMQFAMNYPDLVEKLVVVDIAPKTYIGGHQAIFDALFALDLEQIDSRKEADAFLAERITDYGTRQFLLKNLTREKEGGYRWKMNLPIIYESYQAILETVEGEVFDKESLFIRGSRSNYIQATDETLIKDFFPKAKIESIEAGHWVHAEKPKELLTSIQNFLR